MGVDIVLRCLQREQGRLAHVHPPAYHARDEKQGAGEGEGVSCLARADGSEVLVPVFEGLKVDVNLAPLHEVLVVGFPVARAPGYFLACGGDVEGNGGNSGGDLKVSPFCREIIMQHPPTCNM